MLLTLTVKHGNAVEDTCRVSWQKIFLTRQANRNGSLTEEDKSGLPLQNNVSFVVELAPPVLAILVGLLYMWKAERIKMKDP